MKNKMCVNCIFSEKFHCEMPDEDERLFCEDYKPNNFLWQLLYPLLYLQILICIKRLEAAEKQECANCIFSEKFHCEMPDEDERLFCEDYKPNNFLWQLLYPFLNLRLPIAIKRQERLKETKA
jgi:hypothetical protein